MAIPEVLNIRFRYVGFGKKSGSEGAILVLSIPGPITNYHTVEPKALYTPNKIESQHERLSRVRN